MKHNDAIDIQIMAMVAAETRQLSSSALEAMVMERFELTRRQSRDRIRALVQTAQLVYRQLWGGTFLAPSFHRPVKMSDRIWVCDGASDIPRAMSGILVQIAEGDAFGEGRHPSTRLALQGVDFACEHLVCRGGRPTGMLDVGTGSGILIIAGVRLGIHRGVGLDTDANARFEARRNIRQNGLSDQIDIRAEAVETLSGKFDLVAANLRLPSLISLAPVLEGLVAPRGRLVLSGFKQDEQGIVAAAFRRKRFEFDRTFAEIGWCGGVLAQREGMDSFRK